MKRLLILSAVVLGLASCSTVTSSASDAVSYSETARQNFELGEKALKAGKGAEAQAYFEYVRNKYPYSKYAAEADLGVADSLFADSKWLEAADAYDFYIRFHPVHEKVAYAYFRKAKADFNAMPSDFFLFPKSYTKDQKATQDALEAIERFVKQFPKDENVKEAEEMRVTLRTQLASLDMNVAQFYTKLSRWHGAAQRYAAVIEKFADTPLAKKAMLELAVIKKDKLDKADEAKGLFERLTKEHADSAEAKEAQSQLAKFQKDSAS
jgi:outer membrane protein assembly factor BamD